MVPSILRPFEDAKHAIVLVNRIGIFFAADPPCSLTRCHHFPYRCIPSIRTTASTQFFQILWRSLITSTRHLHRPIGTALFGKRSSDLPPEIFFFFLAHHRICPNGSLPHIVATRKPNLAQLSCSSDGITVTLSPSPSGCLTQITSSSNLGSLK
jgi:hypothetical protein